MGDGIVITGIGMRSPLGLSVAQTWEAVREGRCGIRELHAIERHPEATLLGGEVPDDPAIGPDEPREVRHLHLAMREAIECAGDRFEKIPAHRRACVMGTTLHGMRHGGAYLRDANAAHLRRFTGRAVLDSALADLGFDGPAWTVCSACSSGLNAIILGCLLLESNQGDAVIAGGYDPISEYAYAGFSSLRLVSASPPRPFSRERDGMNIAEGYAAVVLEREPDAKARGAEVLAHVVGWGESSDAHHLTQPAPEGRGAASAMRDALGRAGLGPGSIGLISAHATATPANDRAEHDALADVFGASLPSTPIVAFKSHLGHTLGAAGAGELILSLCAMRNGIMPQTANLDRAAIEFGDLALAPSTRTGIDIAATLNTSLGFGGANTSIVLARRTSGVGSRQEGTAPVITGIGVVLPGVIGVGALAERLGGDRVLLDADGQDVIDEALGGLVSVRKLRRASAYARLTVAAAEDARRHAGLTDGELEHCAAMVGSAHGAAEYCRAYYAQLIDEGLDAANPGLFAEGVPNVGAAHVSMQLGLRGACLAHIGSRTSGLDALFTAAMRVRAGLDERVLVVASEEFSPTVNSAYADLGCGGPGRAAGIGFVVESRNSARGRGARELATIERCHAGRADGDSRWRGVLDGATVLTSGAHAGLRDLECKVALCVGIEATIDGGRVFGELFSATPAAVLASVLLSRNPERPVAVVSCDWSGLATVVRVLPSPQ